MKLFTHEKLTVRPLFKKTPGTVRNSTVRDRVHNSTTVASICSPTHPVHTLPKYFCKINFNIIFLSVLRSCKRTLSFMLPRLHVYIFHFSPIRATCSAHLILRDLITRTADHEAPLVSSHAYLPQHPTFNTPAFVRPIT